jgi:hypothetical protein
VAVDRQRGTQPSHNGLAASSRHIAIALLSASIVATFFLTLCGGAALARPRQHKNAWA